MAVLEALSWVSGSLGLGERSIALCKEGLALSERHDGVPHPNQRQFLVGLAQASVGVSCRVGRPPPRRSVSCSRRSR